MYFHAIMKQKSITGMGIIAFILLLILIAACEPLEKQPKQDAELKKFTSAQQIRDFLKENSDNYYSGYSGGVRILETGGLSMTMAESAYAAKSASPADSGAADYSKTNIQEEGVDEADFVKNDNKHIYIISNNKLVIIDAYPAESAKILSETKIGETARDMLVNKDRLIIFADGYGEDYVISEYDFLPRPVSVSKAHILVYDISDRENPKLVKDYSTKGYYLESRMIDDYAYFIVKENLYYPQYVDMPVVLEKTKAIARPDVYYFDNPEASYILTTIGSLNIFGDNEVSAQSFMIGDSNTIYVSQNSIYIAYQKNLPYAYYERNNEERFYKAIVPLLPLDVQAEIQRIRDDSELSSYEKWDRISEALENMYNNIDESGKKELTQKMEKAIEEYELKREEERMKTVVHKISISRGGIKYAGRGEVSGQLLNQFSLDEFENNLRVATTAYLYTSKGSTIYNNVYVLNDKLEVTGKLERIAPDERIYSTRFMGNKLYMVTFKRIDPLFVIDLSNPENPEILGELKIPGFSDYLHPYDENHIIGIGKETADNEWGGTSVKGVKLALFDVSDVKNPKQIDMYEIGGQGTDSEALHEHKAFLFDKGKNLLVIPVTEVKGKEHFDEKLGYYRQKLWQGAYVFSLTPESGFIAKGKITHNEGDEIREYYYYGYSNAIRRSMFMDDVLYTISMARIKMNDLNNPDKEISQIELPYEKFDYGIEPVTLVTPELSEGSPDMEEAEIIASSRLQAVTT